MRIIRNLLKVILKNVEGTPGAAAPSKAVLMGGIFGLNIEAPRLMATGSDSDTTAKFANALLEYNGASWDRRRNNTEGTLLASAARTAVTASPVQTNHNAKGVTLFLNVTANPGGAETLTIRFYDRDASATANSYPIASLTIPAATNGLFVLAVCPGASGTPDNSTRNKAIAWPVPRTWYADVNPSASGSWTYQLDYAMHV